MLVAAFTWTEFAQQIAAGIREGAIYAGLALAIVIIYRSTRVINFAQGELATMKTEEGMAVLVVEQNANLALAHAARAYVLEVGRVVVTGSSEELRANESVRRSYLGY